MLPAGLIPTVVSYPTDLVCGYEALEALVERALPVGRPFTIVAESFSGPLALRIAAKAPKGLRAVVLVATFVQNPLLLLPPWARFLIGPPLFWCLPPPFAVRRFLLGPDAPRELVSEFLMTLRGVRPAVLAARMRAALKVNETEALCQCSVPILYIAGLQDKLISPHLVQPLSALRADLECVTLDAPHLILQRCPAKAIRLIEDFLARHDSKHG